MNSDRDASVQGPSSLKSRLLPALKVGAMTGATGVITGGVIATLRSTPTVGLFALASGLNWAALGTTYWGYRNELLNLARSRYPEIKTEKPRERIPISAAAGSLAGATVGLVFRGPRNVIRGAIMWGLAGFGGQWVYAVADERHSSKVLHKDKQESKLEKGFWDSFSRSEWSPIKRLSEDEYKKLLEKKLLNVQAEIALVDEEIAQLQRSMPGPKKCGQ